MITPTGPKILEYNVRLGDPETQVLLPLIKSDFGNLCEAMTSKKLDTFPLHVAEKSALGIVAAAPGYPGSYKKSIPVDRLPNVPESEAAVYHASTFKDSSGELKTGGGRCFTVVGLGKDLLAARITAYNAVKGVQFSGAWYRGDIGADVYDEAD
jgi:phosphoribosylamine-glycine ligase